MGGVGASVRWMRARVCPLVVLAMAPVAPATAREVRADPAVRLV